MSLVKQHFFFFFFFARGGRLNLMSQNSKGSRSMRPENLYSFLQEELIEDYDLGFDFANKPNFEVDIDLA